MTYQQDIINRLSQKELWPEFERGNFLGELEGIAEDVFLEETLAGYLGSLLIYIQLIEEIIKLLLMDIEFLTQLKEFPNEYHMRKYDELTFGQIISVLENSIDFEEKEYIISDCREINKIRNDLVHNLTKNQDLDLIFQKVELAKDLYLSVFETFHSAHRVFWRKFETNFENKDWFEANQNISG